MSFLLRKAHYFLLTFFILPRTDELTSHSSTSLCTLQFGSQRNLWPKSLGHLLKVTEHDLNELLSFIQGNLSHSLHNTPPSLQFFFRSPVPSQVPSSDHPGALFSPHSWQKRVSERGNPGHDSSLPPPIQFAQRWTP